MIDLGVDAKSLNRTLKALKKLPQKLSKKRRKQILRKASKAVIKRAKKKINVSRRPHRRKIKKTGKIITYYPGNLRRSIKTLTFRKSNDVFAGAKTDRKNSSSEYSGRKVDAYYAHFVEYGTSRMPPRPYMRPAAREAKGEVVEIVRKETEKVVNEYNKENAR